MTARWSEASQPTNFLSKGFTQPRWWLKISVLQHSTNASNLAPLSSWRASATVAEMPYFSSSSSAAWSKVTQEERHREMFITKSNTTSTVENTWKFNPVLESFSQTTSNWQNGKCAIPALSGNPPECPGTTSCRLSILIFWLWDNGPLPGSKKRGVGISRSPYALPRGNLRALVALPNDTKMCGHIGIAWNGNIKMQQININKSTNNILGSLPEGSWCIINLGQSVNHVTKFHLCQVRCDSNETAKYCSFHLSLEGGLVGWCTNHHLWNATCQFGAVQKTATLKDMKSQTSCQVSRTQVGQIEGSAVCGSIRPHKASSVKNETHWQLLKSHILGIRFCTRLDVFWPFFENKMPKAFSLKRGPAGHSLAARTWNLKRCEKGRNGRNLVRWTRNWFLRVKSNA